MSGCKAWAEGASAEFPCSETSECITTWCPVCTDGVSKRLADVERERGDPEGRQGWTDRPTPTLAEAFEHVQSLAPEGDRESELALGIISEALKADTAGREVEQLTEGLAAQGVRALAAENACQEVTSERDHLAQRLVAMAELRAREAQEAVRGMATMSKDWAADLRKAAEGLVAALKRGYAEATEDAARWAERSLHSLQMVHGEEVDRAAAGALRAGAHRRTQAGGDLTEHVGQDPAKEPV